MSRRRTRVIKPCKKKWEQEIPEFTLQQMQAQADILNSLGKTKQVKDTRTSLLESYSLLLKGRY